YVYDNCCDDIGLGFVASSSSSNLGGQNYVQPAEVGVGVSVEYKEVRFFSTSGSIDWDEFPEMVEDQWYKVVFALVSTGDDDTYDLHTQIWNSNAAGQLYSLRAWRVEPGSIYAPLSENGGMVH